MTIATPDYQMDATAKAVNFDFTLPSRGAFASPPTDEARNESFVTMIQAFASRSVKRAKVDEIEASQWFAHVEGLQGAWGEGASREEAIAELEKAIVGWVEVKMMRGAGIPFLYSADFDFPQSA